MDFFPTSGYVVYGLSTVLSFVSGCLPLLFLAGAGAFGGASKLWFAIFLCASTSWALCYFVALSFIASHARFASCVAALGAVVIAIYSACSICAVARSDNRSPLFVGGFAAPAWLWFSIPLIFNLAQAGLSISRFQQVRSPR
jgi:hypothetical protein